MHNHTSGSGLSAEIIFALPFVFALILYGTGVAIQWRRRRVWPWYRSASWLAGILAAASGFVGPLATAAHNQFIAHMWAHLLVGMAAPLLLVLGAPATLALRSLHVSRARRLSHLLTSWPVRFLSFPIVAATVNIGGMWALYRTPLYDAMQQSMLLHLIVMTHFLLAGYLFTAAIIPIDPAPHRASHLFRLTILVLALAAHGILAKSLYAFPPTGVSMADAHTGAMLMYYAGDLIDATIIAILCLQWYKYAGRDLRRNQAVPASHLSPA